MSEGNNSKRPSFEAFVVREGAEDKYYFNRIGAAFPHKDGEGHTLSLDAVPVDGKIVLRTPMERNDDLRRGKSGHSSRSERDR